MTASNALIGQLLRWWATNALNFYNWPGDRQIFLEYLEPSGLIERETVVSTCFALFKVDFELLIFSYLSLFFFLLRIFNSTSRDEEGVRSSSRLKFFVAWSKPKSKESWFSKNHDHDFRIREKIEKLHKLYRVDDRNKCVGKSLASIYGSKNRGVEIVAHD